MGRARALALASAGAQVLVHLNRGAAEANGVVNEIRKAGGRADAIAADLAAPNGAHKLAKQVRSIVADRLPWGPTSSALVEGQTRQRAQDRPAMIGYMRSPGQAILPAQRETRPIRVAP
jgi:hypothetical protein